MVTTENHEKRLKEVLSELRREGYRTLDLERKCPDGIALKDGKIFAVEILGKKYKKGHGWTNRYSVRAKKSIYHMFDDVIIRTFKYPITKGETPKFPLET